MGGKTKRTKKTKEHEEGEKTKKKSRESEPTASGSEQSDRIYANRLAHMLTPFSESSFRLA